VKPKPKNRKAKVGPLRCTVCGVLVPTSDDGNPRVSHSVYGVFSEPRCYDCSSEPVVDVENRRRIVALVDLRVTAETDRNYWKARYQEVEKAYTYQINRANEAEQKLQEIRDAEERYRARAAANRSGAGSASGRRRAIEITNLL
jgi:hypothetical protein